MSKKIRVALGVCALAGASVLSWQMVSAQNQNQNQNATLDSAMEAWQAANRPGKEHAYLLGNMLGTWNASVKTWFAPNSEPQINSGTARASAKMVGRFVQLDHDGEVFGGKYSAMGLFGYNTTTNQFENVWIDSATTGIQVFQGARSGDTITWNPPGQPAGATSSTRFENGAMIFEMFETASDGTRYKTLEITYTKANGQNQPQSYRGATFIDGDQQASVTDDSGR